LVTYIYSLDVHQTVDASAHTNYLISIVKERSAYRAIRPAKTDNFASLSHRCQRCFETFFVAGNLVGRLTLPIATPKEARILRPLSPSSSPFFTSFRCQTCRRSLPYLASERRIIHTQNTPSTALLQIYGHPHSCPCGRLFAFLKMYDQGESPPDHTLGSNPIND